MEASCRYWKAHLDPSPPTTWPPSHPLGNSTFARVSSEVLNVYCGYKNL